jgi:phosphoenolpyruvate phosphomutase
MVLAQQETSLDAIKRKCLMKKIRTVYLGMSLDVLHHGHINIINEATKYGQLTVGLLTDEVIARNKRVPLLQFDDRKRIVENIVGVHKVIVQEDWSYASNVKKLKPDYFVHGDDWLEGPLAPIRDDVIAELAAYGGKLVEIAYTKGVSSTDLADKNARIGVSPGERTLALRKILAAKPLSRFIEAHSPISALIGEHAKVVVHGQNRQFDGFWSSSLTDSTEMGKPDIESLDISSRLDNINNIFEVTNKPLIMDFDTGGKPEHFAFAVKSMERLGISAVIIEDKTGLKKNSLFGNDVAQTQDSIEGFCYKIQSGVNNRRDRNFLIIARIESLILEAGMDDALERARAYITAGADAIMIHSRQKQPDEIFEFAHAFRKEFNHTPLVCVPTSYNHVYEDELEKHGFNVVIYANHLMRASYPAMKSVASQILTNGRSLEADDQIISIKEILKLIPGTE